MVYFWGWETFGEVLKKVSYKIVVGESSAYDSELDILTSLTLKLILNCFYYFINLQIHVKALVYSKKLIGG